MCDQTHVLLAMSQAERLKAATRLYWSARRLKEAALRAQHPEWTADELRSQVNDAFLFRAD